MQNYREVNEMMIKFSRKTETMFAKVSPIRKFEIFSKVQTIVL